MQNFAGQIRCIMGDVQVAYSAFLSLDLQSQLKIVGKVVQLNSSREFSLLLNNPRLPYSMLGYNRTITCTNINVLLNIGPGARGGRKKRGKKATFPTLDDDCSFLRRHHSATVLFLENWWGNGERSGSGSLFSFSRSQTPHGQCNSYIRELPA